MSGAQAYNRSSRLKDIQSYQNTDFIVGYEIRISNNEKYHFEHCKAIAGKYPKWFIWDGCCEECRCTLVSILINEEEMDQREKSLLTGKNKGITSKNEITEVPEHFLSYLNKNKAIYSHVANIPLFIRMNFIDGDVSKGLKHQTKIKKKNFLSRLFNF